VTPHHLFLDEDAITTAYDTNFKMNPPLRTAEDREALVAGAARRHGRLHRDRSRAARTHEKALEFELAPFGTTGLETALSLVITHLVQPGCSTGPTSCAHGARAARGVSDFPRVRLEPAPVADLTVIDPEARIEVTREWFFEIKSNSAFLGATLLGKATDVLVGGRFALKNGKVVD
jgi:dihydroorotase